MASVNPSFDPAMNAGSSMAVNWSITTAGDTGVRSPVEFANYPDKTVHVTGTFGSVTLRGSNLANPSDATAGDWFTLSDPQGSPLTFTAADGAVIAENPRWISPITTGGSAYTINIVGVKS